MLLNSTLIVQSFNETANIDLVERNISLIAHRMSIVHDASEVKNTKISSATFPEYIEYNGLYKQEGQTK